MVVFIGTTHCPKSLVHFPDRYTPYRGHIVSGKVPSETVAPDFWTDPGSVSLAEAQRIIDEMGGI